jgi:ligand-binding sensor domain-containing protein
VWVAGLGDVTASAFATGSRQTRAGVSFASNDLQRWRWIDGTIAVPLVGTRADAMLVRGNRAWIATDRGLVRVRLDGSESIAAWTTLDGMPDDRVLSLAATADGAWAGTARGLVWVSDSSDTRNPRTRGIGQRLLENTAVTALQSIGDTLWIGTTAGIVALAGGSGAGINVATSALSRPLGSEPALRRPIRAMAWSDSILLAATDDGVLQLTPRRASEPVRVPDLDGRQVGQVTRLTMDDRTIWLAGTDGLLVASRRGGARRLLRVPRDLPGPVTDVVASRDWLWIGTPFGLVRLRRAADGGLP